MRNLAGLRTFVVAVAVAVAVTRYYSTPTQPKEPQPVPAVTQATPAAAGRDPGADVPLALKPQLVPLDFANKKAHVTLPPQRDPAPPAPQSASGWGHFF